MGIFKALIDEIDNDTKEINELISDAALFVENENIKKFEDDVFDGVDSIVKEELIHGYNVVYQYKKVIAKTKENSDRTFFEMRIVSIVQPLNNKVVNDSNIQNLIIDKITRMIK